MKTNQELEALVKNNYENWVLISMTETLSEEFIREFQDKVDWYCISKDQKLSESFIREFQDKVYWFEISKYQRLSENFIREFKYKIDWKEISARQKLSESFIREFKDKVNWRSISIYQNLSESFIREYQNRVAWCEIVKYQKLSEDFIAEFALNIDEDNWLYKDTDYKKQAVVNAGIFECYDDYFIAYKAIREDRYGAFDFQYKYEVGNTYETTADYTDEKYSFGFSVTTEDIANVLEKTSHCVCMVIKVKVRYEDVARVLYNWVCKFYTVRCCKMEILS